MRSQGDNPNSPWKKLTCAGRSYFRRIDTRQVASLDAPSEGVCQNAEFDSNGELVPVQPPSTVEWLLGSLGTPFNKDAWESAYADLGGPECWSGAQNRVYKRKLMAKQICKVVFAASVFLLWFLILTGEISIMELWNNYYYCPRMAVGDVVTTTCSSERTCECFAGWVPEAIKSQASDCSWVCMSLNYCPSQSTGGCEETDSTCTCLDGQHQELADHHHDGVHTRCYACV